MSLLCGCDLIEQIPTVTADGSALVSTVTTPERTTGSTPPSNTLPSTPPATTLPTTPPPLPEKPDDPYEGVDKTAFYRNYTPATSYWDAYYRSQHFLMSGSLDEQDEAPTVAENRPMQNGLYIRNTSAIYEDGGNTYCLLNSEGKIVKRIYRGGGYVTLEDVAAHVYAFGEIPANYVSKKSGNPQTNPWGIYLRLNHSMFSGDTSRYPYEPILPNISGCGGDLTYFEMDIGTTGTDTGNGYAAKPYNNGSKITRGAARIVYARYDANGNHIIDPNERYLFYTYNHYNDFQEYLNYAGGWGEMFGNITGGGVLSSKTDCNPTDYVPTARADLSARTAARILCFTPWKEEDDRMAA